MNKILLRRRQMRPISLKLDKATLDHIEDIEYFKEKLLKSLRVPVKYFEIK